MNFIPTGNFSGNSTHPEHSLEEISRQVLLLTRKLNRKIAMGYLICVHVFVLWMLAVVIKYRTSSFRSGKKIGILVLVLDVLSIVLLVNSITIGKEKDLNHLQAQVFMSGIALSLFSLAGRFVASANWFLAVHLGDSLGSQTVESVVRLRKWSKVYFGFTILSFVAFLPIPGVNSVIGLIAGIGLIVSFIGCFVKLWGLNSVARHLVMNNPQTCKGINRIFALVIVSFCLNVILLVFAGFVSASLYFDVKKKVKESTDSQVLDLESIYCSSKFQAIVLLYVLGSVLPRVLSMIAFSQRRAEGVVVIGGALQTTTGGN